MLRSFLPFLLLFLAAGADASAPGARETRQYAEQLLADAVPEDGPGMAVLVARGDELLYRGARGRASLELDVPLSPDNVFRIGSVTKQFSAAGLLKLVDAGKVALDDPLSKYLPDYPNAENITIVQLLNHTSGIQSYTNLPGYMGHEVRRDLDTNGLIAVFKDKPAEFAPGERWNYNNSGYVLVGAVIEKASGMPWARWLKESLLAPLKLQHTHNGADRSVVLNAASGYSISDGKVQAAGLISMTQPHAAGALLSTVDDLWRWNRALHEGKVLSAESYRRMTTPEGKAGEPPNRYGYGIQAGTIRNHVVYEHGGGINGFVSHLTYMPDGDVTVVVLRNADSEGSDRVGTVARKLAAFAAGDPYPPIAPVDVPEAELKALEGVYRLDENNARTLRLRGGKLTSQRSGGPVFELVPVGDDTFVFGDSFTRITIERDGEGRPVAMRFFQDGEGEGEVWPRTDESVAERTEIELPHEAQARLVGDYTSEQLSFKVFHDDDGVLRVQVPGQPAFALKAETPNKLFITEVDATFEFAPADGAVETCTLTQGPGRFVLQRKPD